MASEWTKVPYSEPISSAEEVWNSIGRLSFRTGNSQWVFRGVSSTEHRVRSSLVRRLFDIDKKLPTEDRLYDAEQSLIRSAREWGIGTVATGQSDDMHLLATMQHAGLPTRLLDVSANPMTALWFACQERRDDYGKPKLDTTHGVVIAFLVSGLETYLTTPPDMVTWDDGVSRSAKWFHALQKSAKDKEPFLIRPIAPDARMVAQEGLFITSAVPKDPLEGAAPLDCLFNAKNNRSGEMAAAAATPSMTGTLKEGIKGPGVVQFTIPAELKPQIRQVLATTFNRSDRTIYPDLMGLRDRIGSKGIGIEGPVLTTVTTPTDPTSGSDHFNLAT